jgi:DNA-binding MarR family transcriptional regulator
MAYNCSMEKATDTQLVFWQLLQLMYQGKHRAYQIAEEYELTVMQSAALMLLSEDQPQAMRKFCDYFMCDASTVTGLVDRLEARSLIHRQNHPSDRRIKLIALTPEGAKLKAEISAKTEAAEAKRFNNVLSVTERATLHDLLTRVLAAPTGTPENAKI